jgi:carbon storage regulator
MVSVRESKSVASPIGNNPKEARADVVITPDRRFTTDRRSIKPRRISMLVLYRRKSESVVIGDNIVVTVVDVRGNNVRLAFDAPRDVPVYRQEIKERMDELRH